jgi:protein TonB
VSGRSSAGSRPGGSFSIRCNHTGVSHESNPTFDQAAIDAVRKWKYKPALKDGQPVAVFLSVVVEFNLK